MQGTVGRVSDTTQGRGRPRPNCWLRLTNSCAKFVKPASRCCTWPAGLTKCLHKLSSLPRWRANRWLPRIPVCLRCKNAIGGGANTIREQIQETSKRIKRLGESSQEIGEITELISDITEQTNVLALNAAIQAASAG